MGHTIVPGRLNHHGRFYPSRSRPLLRRINAYILRWARKKTSGGDRQEALAWRKRVVQREPGMFTHWEWTTESWITG